MSLGRVIIDLVWVEKQGFLYLPTDRISSILQVLVIKTVELLALIKIIKQFESFLKKRKCLPDMKGMAHIAAGSLTQVYIFGR